MHHTTVEFGVVGLNVADLRERAEAVMFQVSGGGKWTLMDAGPAIEDGSIEDWSVSSPRAKHITYWKQDFQGTVEFN